MNKNVFQGFDGKELKNSSNVKGGITYRNTLNRAGAQVDEEAITADGEYDPWNGGTAGYQQIDQTWNSCQG